MIDIAYSYVPTAWCSAEFERLGGFVVVFLNYNKGKLVADAVRSVLNQDYPLLEMIFLDDNSTDGSGDVMERIVRGYKGRHKLTVVRNKINQTIGGQWNIAAKLTSGTWLGMFCGDDNAFPNRVSEIAKLAKAYPTAWGICTNALVAGSRTETFCANHTRTTWSGEDGNTPPENMFGGMTFWRRDIFDTELPRCNMDDYLLQYMVMIRRAKEKAVSLVWALDINTVHYSLAGITNRERREASAIRSPIVRIWNEGKAKCRFDRKYGINVWRHVMAYADRFLEPGKLADQIRGLAIMYRCRSSGWFVRLVSTIKLHTINSSDDFGGVRDRVEREVDRLFFSRFLGLPGYVVYTLLSQWRLKRKGIIT